LINRKAKKQSKTAIIKAIHEAHRGITNKPIFAGHLLIILRRCKTATIPKIRATIHKKVSFRFILS